MKKFFNRRVPVLILAWVMTAALWAMPAALSAHGTAWEMSSKKSYGLEFSYDDETPMAYVEVKVYGPDDPAKLSQTGRTDKNGYFAFIPYADGLWLVTAADGSGHLAKAELPVVSAPVQDSEKDEADAAVAAVNIKNEIAKAVKPWKVALVISVFLNLAFLSMLFKSRNIAR